jgi:hypothetical protein
MSELEQTAYKGTVGEAPKFPLTITGEKLDATVEWRPDRSPLHPFQFLQNDHDAATMDPDQCKQREQLNAGMSLCSINGEDCSQLNYDQTKEKLSGSRPLTLEWYESPPPPARAQAAADQAAAEIVRTEAGILVVGPKEPGSSETITWDLKSKSEEESAAWQYAINHNRALARRAAGIRPQRRRSASWG